MKELQKAWQEAAKSENCSGYISPAANTGKYQESGIASANKLLDVIKAYIKTKPEKLTVIDFGCGNGRVSNPLSQMVKAVYAVDFVLEMLEQIPISERILTIESDSETSDFETPKLADCAFTVSVFIHNTYEDGKKIIKSIAKNVKKGGYLFLDIPIYEVAKDPAGWIDVGVWNIEQLEQVAEDCGLEIIRLYENTGEFSYGNIGPVHGEFNVLKKC